MLANFIWENLILKVFAKVKLPPAGPSLADLLPKKLCDPGDKLQLPGLFMLGDDQVPDLISGESANTATQGAGLEEVPEQQ